MKFTAYGSTQTVPVLERVKLVLKNANGLKVKSMAYVVQGGKESLLGRRDGVALGINNLHLQGCKPDGQNIKQPFPIQATVDHCEYVSRMEILKKQNSALDKIEEK